MANCPSCQTPFEADFGMASCPCCAAIVFVDIDGKTQLGSDDKEKEAEVGGAESDLESESEKVSEPDEEEVEPEPRPPEDLSDIAEFANSEVSTGREGGFLYDVYISKIDTREVRSQLREALTDRRFAWDIEALLSTIRGGKLKLKKINAVKASIVVGRTKNLPVLIEWKQYAITQM